MTSRLLRIVASSILEGEQGSSSTTTTETFHAAAASYSSSYSSSSSSSSDWRFLRDNEASDIDDDDDTASDPNALGTALSYIFLFFLIFGLSATVEIKNLKKQLGNRFAIGTGVVMQFLFMPLLGFLSVLALKSQPGWTQAMGVSLLVVTSSPGGSYSNWWCSTFNADLALSVAMTTVSSLLSIAMLPANLFLYTFLAYGATEEESVVQALDFGTIFLALGIVLSAILSGLIVGYKYDNVHFHQLANRLGTFSGILLVLFSLFLSSGADGAENNFWNQDWAFYIGVAFPCLVGISLANIISRSLRLAPPETVAISIECCYQNTGIATSVAIAMYQDKEDRAMAVAVPLFYGVVEAVAICLYCFWAWKVGWTKAPANERFCTIVSKTYEVAEEGENDTDAEDHDQTDDRTEAGEATLSSRFADEQSLRSVTGKQQQQQQQKRVWFWQRWLGGDSNAAAATNNNNNNNNTDASPQSVKQHIKAVDTAPVTKNGNCAELASPHAPLMLSSTLETSPTSYRGTESVADTLSSAASPASLSAVAEMAFTTVNVDDFEVASGCTPTNRDRTYTVETSASSNPPTTPNGRREIVSFAQEATTVIHQDEEVNTEVQTSSVPTMPGFVQSDQVVDL
mmetsp:Transcript_8199/g.22745  ORF Transcript_8199/g.22745 Transcript_8199/m.22745 type:complete len:627 (+) Transcript_8199:293-2173(+)